MVSDISPKQDAGKKYIGYKGLGFRSILGWASSIAILSGNAKIGFSPKQAQSWLLNLKGKHQNIEKKVIEFTRFNEELKPIATLNAPKWLDGLQNEDEFSELVDNGQAFIQKGYNTVVCISFDDVDVYEQIDDQIRTIQGETFVFLQHLLEVKIETSEYINSWQVERDTDVVEVIDHDGTPQIWDLFSEKDEIPYELLEEDKTENKYEITLAIPTEDTNSPGKIFVYFPTKEEFPFKLIAHATFDLSANRQRINDSGVNQYISDRLAELMSETAGKLVRKSDPWFAASRFIPGNSYLSSTLSEFGFSKRLKDQLKEQEIVPTINGTFRAATGLFRISQDFQSFKHVEVFEDIALFSDDSGIFDYLDIFQLPHDAFVERVDSFSEQLSLQLRAELIKKYIKTYTKSESKIRPNLLIDQNAQLIEGSSSTSLPPEKQSFDLPEWVPVRIIHSDLVDELKRLFTVESVRDLRYILSLFKVQEYNLTTVVSRVVAASNERVKQDPPDEKRFRLEQMETLWQLYRSMENPGRFQERITVPIISSTGETKPASSLYFSKEYSIGLISGYLYENIGEDLLIAHPTTYGFEDISHQHEEFLKWLGVSDLPRLKSIPEVRDKDFLQFVNSNLADQVEFNDLTKTKAEILEEPNWCFRIKEAKSFDHLEAILATADQHAILAWIADCNDLEDLRRTGDIEARYLYVPNGLRKERILTQIIPSYAVWLINTTQWLVARSDEYIRMAPLSMSMAKPAKDLSPIIGYPAIDMDHEIFETLGFDKTAVSQALSKSGVVYDINDFPWSIFYQILFHLPEIDPDCRNARTIYRSMITKGNDDDNLPSPHENKQFLEEGKIAGVKNSVFGYYSVDQIFYVQNNTLPNHIANHYPIALMDRRRNAKKIKTIFGIDVLNSESINTEILKVEEHPGDRQFNDELERLKPHIYAIRIDADTKENDLRAISKFGIKLCTSLECTIEVNSENIPINIQPGKSIIQDDVVYLITDNMNDNLIMDELMANAIGELLSNLLKVDLIADIARILSCSVGNRVELLSSILGSDGLEYLERAQSCLGTPEIQEPDFSLPEPHPETESVANETDNKEEYSSEDESESEETKADEIGEVKVSTKGHNPTKPSKRTLVVSRNPGKTTRRMSEGRVSADRAEELAMKFEEYQGRYPRKVSHYRGTIAPGCDIISFSAKSDREQFEATYTVKVDYSAVLRFVEVKGSNSSTGSIVLAGNELLRAQKSKDKYFLYRIYESQKGVFELVELSDPLSEEASRKIQYEINPFQSENTLRWDVSEEIESE